MQMLGQTTGGTKDERPGQFNWLITLICIDANDEVGMNNGHVVRNSAVEQVAQAGMCDRATFQMCSLDNGKKAGLQDLCCQAGIHVPADHIH